VGSSGLGYAVTDLGNLVRFNLFDPIAGASIVLSGEDVQAAQALTSGQVAVAFANGDVSLLSPKGNGLAVTSIFQAEAGLPASPSAIDVVSKSDGQFNVLVSSAGSDTIFVFDQVASSGETAGSIVSNPVLPSVNSFQPSLATASSQGLTLTTATVAVNATATAATTSASASASSSSTSASATATIGLSLGTFSSLGNGSTSSSGDTLLVAVEGNAYLSVPIFDIGLGTGEEAGAGEGRIPGLSRMYPFGDTSPLTRFVIGLDEALRGYRGDDNALDSKDGSSLHDPWNEDLFHHHAPVSSPSNQPENDGPRAEQPGFRPRFEGIAVEYDENRTGKPRFPHLVSAVRIGAAFMSLAGLVAAVRLRATGVKSAPGAPATQSGFNVDRTKRFRVRPTRSAQAPIAPVWHP
jgi:hypothetical protein